MAILDDLEKIAEIFKELYEKDMETDVDYDKFFKEKFTNVEHQLTVLTCAYAKEWTDDYSIEEILNTYGLTKNDAEDRQMEAKDYLSVLNLNNGISLSELEDTYKSIENNEMLEHLDGFIRNRFKMQGFVKFVTSNNNQFYEKVRENIPQLSLEEFDDVKISFLTDSVKYREILKFNNVETALYSQGYIQNRLTLQTQVTKRLEKMESDFTLKTDMSYVSDVLKEDMEKDVTVFFSSSWSINREHSAILKNIIDKRGLGYYHNKFFERWLCFIKKNRPDDELNAVFSSLYAFNYGKSIGYALDENINDFLKIVDFEKIEQSLMNVSIQEHNDVKLAKVKVGSVAWGCLFLLKQLVHDFKYPVKVTKYLENCLELGYPQKLGKWAENLKNTSLLVLNALDFGDENSLNEHWSGDFKCIGNKLNLELEISVKEENGSYLDEIRDLLINAFIETSTLENDFKSWENSENLKIINEKLEEGIYAEVEKIMMKNELKQSSYSGEIASTVTSKKIKKF